MKYAYFPGCSATSTGISYTLSYNYVADLLGIELKEIPDWNCCGASAAHTLNEDLGDALPARSLAISEREFGDTPVLAPCAGCYLHLKNATAHARADEKQHKHIVELIDRPWEASAEVVNGLEPFLEPEIQDKIKRLPIIELRGLKVACYYGCALLRPNAITQFDDDEQPHSMEDIVELIGATPIDWAFKNECCGASHHIAVPGVARDMVRAIMENAAANGADAIACACPLCMLNLDMREEGINRKRKEEGLEPLNLPIYYFTELLAISLGATAHAAGLDLHFQPAIPRIEQAAIAGLTYDPEEEARKEKEAKKQAALELAAKRKAERAAKEASAEGKEVKA